MTVPSFSNILKTVGAKGRREFALTIQIGDSITIDAVGCSRKWRTSTQYKNRYMYTVIYLPFRERRLADKVDQMRSESRGLVVMRIEDLLLLLSILVLRGVQVKVSLDIPEIRRRRSEEEGEEGS